jgi:hypothetical protein
MLWACLVVSVSFRAFDVERPDQMGLAAGTPVAVQSVRNLLLLGASAILTGLCRGFLQRVQARAWIDIQLGHNSFLSNSFPFTVHLTSHSCTLYLQDQCYST